MNLTKKQKKFKKSTVKARLLEELEFENAVKVNIIQILEIVENKDNLEKH